MEKQNHSRYTEYTANYTSCCYNDRFFSLPVETTGPSKHMYLKYQVNKHVESQPIGGLQLSSSCEFSVRSRGCWGSRRGPRRSPRRRGDGTSDGARPVRIRVVPHGLTRPPGRVRSIDQLVEMVRETERTKGYRGFCFYVFRSFLNASGND